MFVSFSTDTAYDVVKSVENVLGLKSSARLEGQDGDLSHDLVDGYSVYENVCQKDGMDGTDGADNPCTIISASTPEVGTGLVYNSLTDAGKVYDVFFFNEEAINLNQSAFFLNNNPGEQNKSTGYFWELSTSDSSIAKFFSIFENVYDFSLRKGSESYREDNGQICDVASDNFCYFKISDEKYLNYYEVNFENRYILNDSAGGYYFETPANYYESHFETVNSDYKGIYLKQEYRQEYVKTDANGKVYGDSGFNSSSYYKDGYYYLYNSKTHRFDKYSTRQSDFLWINIENNDSISSGYNSSHFFKNEKGELYVLINDKDEKTLRKYFEYDESVSETYLSATLGDVAYYVSTIDPNSNALTGEKYFETGNFKWINYFTLEQPIFKGEAWINESFYTSDPNSDPSLTESGNYSFTYLASKYQNEYVRNYAKLMNTTWFWGNAEIGYKNGYFYELTGTKEEYTLWNRFLNTVKVVLPTNGEKDYYYYKDAVNPSDICNPSSAYVGYTCYSYDVSNAFRMFVEYGVSNLFERWSSASLGNWSVNNQTSGASKVSSDVYNANATNTSGERVGSDVYRDNNGYFRINKGVGHKYSFTYTEYNWSNVQSTNYVTSTVSNHTGSISPNDLQTSKNVKYLSSGARTEYQNKGTEYNLSDKKNLSSMEYTKGKENFTHVIGNYYLSDSKRLVYAPNGITSNPTVEYHYNQVKYDYSLSITYKIRIYKKYIARSNGWGEDYWPNVTTFGKDAILNDCTQGTWWSTCADQRYVQEVGNRVTITIPFSQLSGKNYLSDLSSYIVKEIKSKLSLGANAVFASSNAEAKTEIKSKTNTAGNNLSSDNLKKYAQNHWVAKTVYFIPGINYTEKIEGNQSKETIGSKWSSSEPTSSIQSVQLYNIAIQSDFGCYTNTDFCGTPSSSKNPVSPSGSKGTKYEKTTATIYDFSSGNEVVSNIRYGYNIGNGSRSYKTSDNGHNYTSGRTTTYKSNGQYDDSDSYLRIYNGKNNYHFVYTRKQTWDGVSKNGYIIYDPKGKRWTNYDGGSKETYKSDTNSALYSLDSGKVNQLFLNDLTINSLTAFKDYFRSSYTSSENTYSGAYKINNISFKEDTINAYQKERINLYKLLDKNKKTYYFANSNIDVNKRNQDLLTQNSIQTGQGAIFQVYQGRIDSDTVYKINGYGASYKDGYDTKAHKISSSSNGYIYTYTRKVVTKDNVTESVTKTDTVKSAPSGSLSNGIEGSSDGSVNASKKLPTSYTNEAKCVIQNGQNNCTYYTYQKTNNKEYKYKYNVYKRVNEDGKVYKDNNSIFIAGKTKNDRGYSFGSDANYQNKKKNDITTSDTSSYSKMICGNEGSRGLADCYILTTTRKLSDSYAKIRIADKVLDHYETITNDFVTTISQNTSDINYAIPGNIPLCKDDYLDHPNEPSLNIPCYKYNEGMRELQKEWIKYTYGEKTRNVSTERVFLNTYDSNGNFVDAISTKVDIVNLFDLKGFILNKKFLLNAKGEIIFDASETYENVISNTNGTYSLTVYGSNLNGSIIYINGAKHVLNSEYKQTIKFSSSGNLTIKIVGSEFKGNIERVMLNSGDFRYYIPYSYETSKNQLSLKRTDRVNFIEHKFVSAPVYESWQYFENGDTIYNDAYFKELFKDDIYFKNFNTSDVLTKNELFNKYIFVKDGQNSELLDGENDRTRYKIFLFDNKRVVLNFVKQYDRKTFFVEGDSLNVLPQSYYTNADKKIVVNVKDVEKLNSDLQNQNIIKHDAINNGDIYYNDIVSYFSSQYGQIDNEHRSFILKDGKVYFKKDNKNTYLYDYGEFDIVHTYPRELTFDSENEAKSYLNKLFKGTSFSANTEGNNYTNLGIGTIDEAGNFSDLAKNSPESKYRIVKNSEGKYIIQIIYAVNKDTLAFSDKAKEEYFEVTSSSGKFSYNGKENTFNSSKDFFKLFNSNHSEITFEEGVATGFTNFKDATFYLFDKYQLQGRWNEISFDQIGDGSLKDKYNPLWNLGVNKEDSDKQKALALFNNTFILNLYGSKNPSGYYKEWQNIFSQDNILGFGINSNKNNLNLITFKDEVKFYYAFDSSKLNINSSANFVDNTSYANPSIVKYGFGNSFTEALGKSDSDFTGLGYQVGSMTLSEVYASLSANGSNSNIISIPVYQYGTNGGNAQEGTLNLYLPFYFRDINIRLSRYVLQKTGSNYIVSGVESYESLTSGDNFIISLLNIGGDRDSFIDFSSIANFQTFGNKVLTFAGSGSKENEKDFGVSENWLLSEVLKKNQNSEEKIPEFILKNEGLDDVTYAGATFRSSTGENSLQSQGCFLWWCWTNVDDADMDKGEEYRAKVWQYNAVSNYDSYETKGFNYSVYALKEFYEIENPTEKYNYNKQIENIAKQKLTSINNMLFNLSIMADDYIRESEFNNETQALTQGGYESRGTTYNKLRELANDRFTGTIKSDLLNLLSSNYITLRPTSGTAGRLKLELSDTRYLPTINSYFDDIESTGLKYETFGTLSYILNNSVSESGETSVVLNVFRNYSDIGGSVTADFSNSTTPELYFVKKGGIMYVYQKIINANFINGPQSFTPYVFNFKSGDITSNNISSILNNGALEEDMVSGTLNKKPLDPTRIISANTMEGIGGSLCNNEKGELCTLNLMWQTSIYDYLPIINNNGYVPSNFWYGTGEIADDPYLLEVSTLKENEYYTYDFFPNLAEGDDGVVKDPRTGGLLSSSQQGNATYLNEFLAKGQIFKVPYKQNDLEHMFVTIVNSAGYIGEKGQASIYYWPGADKDTVTGWKNAEQVVDRIATPGDMVLDFIGALFAGGGLVNSFSSILEALMQDPTSVVLDTKTFADYKEKNGVAPTVFGVYAGWDYGLNKKGLPLLLVCETDKIDDCVSFNVYKSDSEGYSVSIKAKAGLIGTFTGFGSSSEINIANVFSGIVDWGFGSPSMSRIDFSELFKTNDRYYLSPTFVKNEEHPWYCFGADCSDSGLEVSMDEFYNAGSLGFYFAMQYYSSAFSFFGAQGSVEDFMNNEWYDNRNPLGGWVITGTPFYYLVNEQSYGSTAYGGGYYHYNTILPYVYNDDFVSTQGTGASVYNDVMGSTSTSSTPISDWLSRLVQEGTLFDITKSTKDVESALGGVGGRLDTDARLNKTTYTFEVEPLVSSTKSVLSDAGDVTTKYSDLIEKTMIGYDYSVFTYVPGTVTTLVGQYDVEDINSSVDVAVNSGVIDDTLRIALRSAGVVDFKTVEDELNSDKIEEAKREYLTNLLSKLYVSPYKNNKLLNVATESKYISSCPVGFEFEKDGKCYFTGSYLNYQNDTTYTKVDVNRYDYLINSTFGEGEEKESLMYMTDFFKNMPYTNYTLKFGALNNNEELTSLPGDMDVYVVIRPRFANGVVGKETVSKIHIGEDVVNNPYGSRFTQAIEKKEKDSPYYFTNDEVKINLIEEVREGYYDDKGELKQSADTNDHYAKEITLGNDGKLLVNVKADEVKYLFLDPLTKKMIEGTSVHTLKGGTHEIVSPNGKTVEVIFFSLNTDLSNIIVYPYLKNGNVASNYDWRNAEITRQFVNDFYTYSKEYQKDYTVTSLGWAPSNAYLGRSKSETTIPDRLRLQYTVETMGITNIYFDIFKKDGLSNQSNSVLLGNNSSSTIQIALENGYGEGSTTYLSSDYAHNSAEDTLQANVFNFSTMADKTGTIGSRVNEFTKDFYANNNTSQLKPENLNCHSINGGNCASNGYADYNLADSLFFNNDTSSKYGAYNLRIDEFSKNKGEYSDEFNKNMELLKGVEYKIVYRYQYNPGGESVFLNINQDYYSKNKESYITWKKSYDQSSDYSLFETVTLNGHARPLPAWTGSGINDAYDTNSEAITYEPSYDISGTGYFIQDEWQVSENTYVVVKYIDTWYLARLNENGTYGVIVNRS